MLIIDYFHITACTHPKPCTQCALCKSLMNQASANPQSYGTASQRELRICMLYMSVYDRWHNLWKHIKRHVCCRGLWTDEATNADCSLFLWGPEVGPGVRTGWRDQMDRSLFTMQLGRGVGGFSGRGAWSIRCFPFVQTGSQTANKQNESTHCWSNRAVNTIPCCTELGTQGIVCSRPQLLHRLMATDKQLLTVMTHTDCCAEVKLLLSWQSAL